MQELINQFISNSRAIADKNLSWGASGNMSMRQAANTFVVSASGSHFAEMADSDVSICKFDDANFFNGKKPSVEAGLHREIYKRRDDVNVIVHVHPFFSVLMTSASNVEMKLNIVPEVDHYVGNVQWVEYFKAGTDVLAKAAAEKSLDTNLIVLKNHGIVSFGENFQTAMAAVEAFEFIAKMNYYARIGDLNIPELD